MGRCNYNDLITILILSACRLDNVNSDILDSISLSIRYERYSITRPECQTPMLDSSHRKEEEDEDSDSLLRL